MEALRFGWNYFREVGIQLYGHFDNLTSVFVIYINEGGLNNRNALLYIIIYSLTTPQTTFPKTCPHHAPTIQLFLTSNGHLIPLYFNTISIIISLPIQVTKAAENELQGRENKKPFELVHQRLYLLPNKEKTSCHSYLILWCIYI